MMEPTSEYCGHEPRDTGSHQERRQVKKGFPLEPPEGTSTADLLSLAP